MMQRVLMVSFLTLFATGSALGQTEQRFSETVYSAQLDHEAADVWPRSVAVFAAPGADVAIDGPIGMAMRERGIPVSVFGIADLRQFEESMSDGLPADPQEAAQEVARRVEAGAVNESMLNQGWVAVMMARQMKISRVPAVVFDGNRIVYGESSLDVAVMRYRASRVQSTHQSTDVVEGTP